MGEFNNGKFNRRNLEVDKERGGKLTFRYGGLSRDFDRTIGEWASDWALNSDNPFLRCGCCQKEMDKNGFPYTGVFHVAPQKFKYRNKFGIICKECAYRISDVVIEADGTEHKIQRKER